MTAEAALALVVSAVWFHWKLPEERSSPPVIDTPPEMPQMWLVPTLSRPPLTVRPVTRPVKPRPVPSPAMVTVAPELIVSAPRIALLPPLLVKASVPALTVVPPV